MDPDDVGHFNDSHDRCMRDPAFTERFYEILVASSEEVREKFRDTDFKKQRRMIRASFLLAMLMADSKPEGRVHFERMAALHGRRDRDIPPHLYTHWLDSLVEAVRRTDPDFSPRVERVWREMMAPGIQFMKDRYDGDPGAAPNLDPPGKRC
jgi:truncated hemoglobin YjbI